MSVSFSSNTLKKSKDEKWDSICAATCISCWDDNVYFHALIHELTTSLEVLLLTVFSVNLGKNVHFYLESTYLIYVYPTK